MSPSRVVRVARDIGLAAVAIADHDTSAGVEEALEVGERLGVEVVPALEINTDLGDREIHILGYLVWPLPARLSSLLGRMRAAREGRIDEMVRRLKICGVDISAARVREIAGKGVIGRPHVARAMVEAGKARSVEEAFEAYLDIGRPCYVERYKITPQEAVREIALAGGVPVLAHPGSAKRDDLIPELVRVGLKGIEVYHPDHDPVTVKRYLGLAAREGLIITGGSDSHGEDDRGPTIGRATVPYSVVTGLKELKAEMEYLASADDIIHPGTTSPGGYPGEVSQTNGRGSG